MPLINPTLPNDGENADAADVNVPFQAILSLINGLLDDDNIAELSGTKITAGTLPISALDATFQTGWIAAGETWAYGANAGNKEFTITITGDKTAKYSPGMRVRLARSVTPPTQCTDLEASSTQYANDTSVSGIVFTDDFTIEA